jgi:hypothetical protein
MVSFLIIIYIPIKLCSNVTFCTENNVHNCIHVQILTICGILLPQEFFLTVNFYWANPVGERVEDVWGLLLLSVCSSAAVRVFSLSGEVLSIYMYTEYKHYIYSLRGLYVKLSS